jgi:hypothetical protein
MFIPAQFTTAKLWNQHKYPKTDEWIKKLGMYIQWRIIYALRSIKLGHL